MRNKQVADHLRLIAQLMTLDGANRFKVRAFNDAADAVEHGRTNIEEVEDPASLDGVGSSTADVIVEFLAIDTSTRALELERKMPGTTEALTMTIVDGIGAKTALKFKEKGIKNFDELFAAAERGELREKLTTAVKFAKEKASGRIAHAVAKIVADFVVESISDSVDKIQVCGSFRRKRLTSKDIDVVACIPAGADRAAIFKKFGELGEVINVGDKKSSVWVTRFNTSMQVDLWLVDKWYWGSALHYATGSKEHVKDIRARARAQGFTVNEYGVFPAGTTNGDFSPDNQLAGRTEESMYNFFGLKYPEPEDRENKAEEVAVFTTQ